MSNQELSVVGIGNAIVVVIGKADDLWLDREGVVKGSMRLIDADQARALASVLVDATESCGGSAGNTIAGVRSLGGAAGYMGKVARDRWGECFAGGMQAAGVEYPTARSTSGVATACCVVMVTPDAQRTLNTFLGACVELGPEDVDEALIRRSRVTYLEGYLWDPPQAKAAFLRAAAIAHAAERTVALTLSDAFCVGRHRESFRELVSGHVDVLFANEAEIGALYGIANFDDAVRVAREQVRIAALTRGANGCTVVWEGEVIDIPAEPVDKVVDTTGAGDLFAAGFLHGLVNGRPPFECGRLGGICAAEVIRHYGARPEASLAELVAKRLR